MIYDLRILIVGLTTVLALTGSKSDFRNDCKKSGYNYQIKI